MTRKKQINYTNTENRSPFRVLVSYRFISLSLVSCILLAFAVGRTARILLLTSIVENQNQETMAAVEVQQQNHAEKSLTSSPSAESQVVESNSISSARLPNPIVQVGKTMPETLYSSRNFNTAGSATIISRFLTWGDQCEDEKNDRKKKVMSMHEFDEEDEPEEEYETTNDDDDDELDEEEIHLPAGQHLLLDIKNVDSSFLASEERLANAMLEIVYECGLTLLSYHCHGLQPSGVSCVGVLLESHVSFHTWPKMGVITLDLFTCGPNSLLPIFTSFRKLFSVPSKALDQSNPKNWPRSLWSYKLRGFSANDWDTKSARTDLFTFPIGSMTDYKEEIASLVTDDYRMDIYDVLRPHFQSIELYEASLADDGSYESLHPELFAPDRIVFLDGVLQSRRSGDASYHETLVHPAMFAHSDPKRVLILGGGSSAVVREVLKHSTVQKVVKIEQEYLWDAQNEFFPDYSDCSPFVPEGKSCFDDPRMHLILLDDDPSEDLDFVSSNIQNDTFDVIFIDEDMYIDIIVEEENTNLIELLFGALSSDGILATYIGDAPSISDDINDSDSIRKYKLIQMLTDVGFKNVKDYQEGNSGFSWPWEAIIAFKNIENMRTGWLQNEALISLAMRRRAIPQIDGHDGSDTSTTAFKYYDGAMHQSYLYPSKATDTLYCRRTIPETPVLCDDDNDLVKGRTSRLQSQVDVDQKSCTILHAISKHGILSKTQAAKALMKYVGEYAWDSICNHKLKNSHQGGDGDESSLADLVYNPVNGRRGLPLS